MNKIDTPHSFTADAVRAHKDSEPRSESGGKLSPTALQIATQYRRDTMSPVMVSGTLRLIEFSLLALAGVLVSLWYVGAPAALGLRYLLTTFVGAGLAVMLLELSEGYRMSFLRRPGARLSRLTLIWAGTLALIALGAFFLKISEDYSRVWFAGWFVAGLVAMVALRIVMARLIVRWARNGTMERRAVIVGGGKAAEALIRSLEREPANDIRICGIFDDRDNKRSPPVVAGYPKLGTVEELVEFARVARIDMLIVSLPLTAQARVLSMLKKLWVLPVDIRMSAHSSELRFRPRAYSYIGSVPLLDILDKPINDWDSVAKRGFDIVFSLLGIILFSPIMIATAIAIKLDSKGPVLFMQKRHGFNNEEINVYKFRSMYVEQCDPTAKQAVTRDDPRVTRVGRFIRKASIDELPQFFNALNGSLSLVGPRPHAVAGQTRNRLYHEVVDGYFARHKVKPGVTGWAQINGWRGEIDSDEKIRMRTEYDLHYIENWSLWFDLKILFLTPISLLKSENAY